MSSLSTSTLPKHEAIAPGVWRTRFGSPEKWVPTAFRSAEIQIESLGRLPATDEQALPPIMEFRTSARGVFLQIALSPEEQIFGFGLQLKSLDQTGKKKLLRVNSDPVADTGDSHAPVPYFISTAGYAVMVDTARSASFHVASHAAAPRQQADLAAENVSGSNPAELYASKAMEDRSVMVEIPLAQGVDVYWFGGPDMRTALQRYNLFSGGGCLPPLSSLGFWYRVAGSATQDDVLAMAREFREKNIPCDILGLEPGWQSHSYSCSYQWSSRFPAPKTLLTETAKMGYGLNLWEHAFTHPSSPLFPQLVDQSGDIGVWGGLVPDFAQADVRRKFADFHRSEFAALGVAGFKLDECDGSDFIPSPWSFPDFTRFPSGLDGEQMHALFGVLYQQVMLEAYRPLNRRICGAVRSSQALAASLPFVLYSDLYDHRDFVRGVLTSGLSGLLWSPEVRQCSSPEDLLRRMQTVMLSPQALLNGWMINNPPWKQVDAALNNEGKMAPYAAELEAACRELIRFRMSLIPYLYAAFAEYRRSGLPPFRPLVVDYPDDLEVYKRDDIFLIGSSLLAAPAFVGQTERVVYFPKGRWHCFRTEKIYEGPGEVTVEAPLERIPLFVRDNTLLPLAEPVAFCATDTVFQLDVRVFGSEPEPFILWEDDGISFDHETGSFNEVTLNWQKGTGTVQRTGNYSQERYQIRSWITSPDTQT